MILRLYLEAETVLNVLCAYYMSLTCQNNIILNVFQLDVYFTSLEIRCIDEVI